MKITNYIKKFKKAILKTGLVAAVIVSVAVPAKVLADWGPVRATFDYNKFDATKLCTDPANANSRCGSLTGPVFDSFVNTPTYGDERNFTTVSPADTSRWTESLTVNPGDTVDVRVFVHNNANTSLNGSALDGPGVALNTRVRFAIPTGQANGIDIGGYVGASNATPDLLYDTATLKNDTQAFSLQYVPGSAKIINSGPFSAGAALNQDANLFNTTGALIGYNALDGKLPGCFDYQAVIIIKVKVMAPSLRFSKKVTTPGSTNWQPQMTAKRGDTVSWLLDFSNNGSDSDNLVTLRDTLPTGLSIIPGSITWFDTNHASGEVLPDTALGSGGVNVGTYAPNGGGYIRFRTKIDPNYNGPCDITNQAFVKAVNVPELNGSAKVTIENCVTPTNVTPTTPVVAVKPAALPNTGPGDIAEFFTAMTAGSGAAFHVFNKRRSISR